MHTLHVYTFSALYTSCTMFVNRRDTYVCVCVFSMIVSLPIQVLFFNYIICSNLFSLYCSMFVCEHCIDLLYSVSVLE